MTILRRNSIGRLAGVEQIELQAVFQTGLSQQRARHTSVVSILQVKAGLACATCAGAGCRRSAQYTAGWTGHLNWLHPGNARHSPRRTRACSDTGRSDLQRCIVSAWFRVADSRGNPGRKLDSSWSLRPRTTSPRIARYKPRRLLPLLAQFEAPPFLTLAPVAMPSIPGGLCAFQPAHPCLCHLAYEVWRSSPITCPALHGTINTQHSE